MTLFTLQVGSIMPNLLLFFSAPGSYRSLCWERFIVISTVDTDLSHLVYQHPHGDAVQVEPVQEVLDSHVCLLVHSVGLPQLKDSMGHGLDHISVTRLHSLQCLTKCGQCCRIWGFLDVKFNQIFECLCVQFLKLLNKNDDFSISSVPGDRGLKASAEGWWVTGSSLSWCWRASQASPFSGSWMILPLLLFFYTQETAWLWLVWGWIQNRSSASAGTLSPAASLSSSSWDQRSSSSLVI